MILVTGGGGLMGLSVVCALVDRGEEVLILQRHAPEAPSFLAPFWDRQVKVVEGSTLDLPFICSLMTTYPIDSIIHTAVLGSSSKGSATLYQIVQINVLATANMLEVARIFNLRRMTYISSLAVYSGLYDKEEWREDMDLPIQVQNEISATKRASEQICTLYKSICGMSAPIIRVGHIYGPISHRPRNNSIHQMVRCAVQGKLANLLDMYEGSYNLPIHTKDLGQATAIVHLAKELRYDIYNCSDGNFVTNQEIADMVKDVVPGVEIHLGTDKRLYKPLLPMSIERLKDEGWMPEYADLKKGIQAYVDYLRQGKY